MRKGEEQRERILDELETLLIDEGAGVLTMDRVAEAAGLSKGGLIYHFPTKEALLAGFQERVAKVGDRGAARMLADPAGAVEYYIFSAAPPASDLDRTILAAPRLSGAEHPEIRELMHDMTRKWVRVMSHVTGHEALARLMLLIGDGVYYQAIASGDPFALSSGTRREDEAEELRTLVGARAPGPTRQARRGRSPRVGA